MSTLAKAILTLAKDKRVQQAIACILGICLMLVMIMIAYITETSQGSSSALAQKALEEYEYWENTEISESGYSCQGEKYCSHFNYPVVDWCCIFVGYCADAAGIDLEEIGYSINTGVWKDNLIRLGDYQDPDTYQPRRGNVVLFDYSGRAHHKATGYTAHIGVVVEVSSDNSQITVIAGNESGSNGATTSRINKYQISATDDRIACYGSVGAEEPIMVNELNSLVRDIVTHNEIGCVYSEINDEYGSVVPCDVDAITIGVYGWHADRALDLLQSAYSINATEVSMICSAHGSSGRKLENDIISNASWRSYIPDRYTASCIRTILLSNAGKQAQDELTLQDAQNYIEICEENGMTDPQSIAYCCDILNQWGNYSFNSGGCLNGVTGSITLSEVYNSRRAWSDSRYNYYNRRTWTYNYIKDQYIIGGSD